MNGPDDSQDRPSPPPRPPARRVFFRQILLKGLDRVEEAGKAVVQKFDPKAPPPFPTLPPPAIAAHTPAPAVLRYLRPPGALPEPLFADTCSRCGDCVKACPAQCIELDPAQAKGLPHVVARESPCVVCDDLSCMKVCPTGALKLVDSPSQIQMGIAVPDHDRCLRTPKRLGAPGAAHGVKPAGDAAALAGPAAGGEDCRLCITPCPMGEAAIGLDAVGRVEVRAGCVGCGVCERACPTEPTSIWVERNM